MSRAAIWIGPGAFEADELDASRLADYEQSPMNIASLLIGLLALSSAVTARGEVQFPVPPPSSQVGEISEYRNFDPYTGLQVGKTSRTELIEGPADRYKVRNVETGSTWLFTKEWQPCRSLRNSDEIRCGGPFKFPLQVGNEHKIERLPAPHARGYRDATCVVQGAETVAVPAGTFEAVRVDCTGTWTDVFSSEPMSGSYQESIWYAPNISRMIKAEFLGIPSRPGQTPVRTGIELVKFDRQ